MSLDLKIAELAARYRPLAVELLREAIRIPADYVDRPVEEGGDPHCGLSNHEGPRLEYLRRRIVEIGAVDRDEDAFFDGFGNLVWTLSDPDDGVPEAERTVIWTDGHTDTVMALPEQWHAVLGEGIDAYNGLTDPERVNKDALRGELGYLPAEDEWQHLVFGRGAADQLSGVICQIVATKVLRELRSSGAMTGITLRGYGSVAEEDNDGGGPMWVLGHELPGAAPGRVPDVVLLSEGTGDAGSGSVGIYRGQRGRMQIAVEVIGRSCHGSMPWEGLNPLEFGGRIIAEAADRYDRREGFLDDPFLGHGTRTASQAWLDTPSDCAVPQRFTFRFDRRLTIGETPDQCVADIDLLPAVAAARAAGLTVNITVPIYDTPTWRGTVPGNPQFYAGWLTPHEHPAICAAQESYRRVVTEHIDESQPHGNLRAEPRVSRWIFSTDGVGFPVPADDTSIAVPSSKNWVDSGAFKHPAMFGVGPGIEQNTHKLGECVDSREMQHVIAFYARFPTVFRGWQRGEMG